MTAPHVAFLAKERMMFAVLMSSPVLMATLLLILNDRVFKWLWPGWVTGKLSDVAGLIVATALLAIPLRCAVRDSVRAHSIAAVVVASLFAVVQLSPSAAAAVSSLLSVTIGPSHIWPDPTDLLALPAVFIPVALARRRCEPRTRHAARSPRSRSGSLQVAVLIIASLACLATSMEEPPEPTRVIALWTHADEVYAGLHEHPGAESADPDIAVSADGVTWHEIETPWELSDGELFAEYRDELPESYPHIECADSQHCYRIDGRTSKVEESSDGGVTWSVAWELTPGQIDRIVGHKNPTGRTIKPADIAAADLAIINESRVIVAVGYDGVVVRHGDGVWRRHAALTAQPQPLP